MSCCALHNHVNEIVPLNSSAQNSSTYSGYRSLVLCTSVTAQGGEDGERGSSPILFSVSGSEVCHVDHRRPVEDPSVVEPISDTVSTSDSTRSQVSMFSSVSIYSSFVDSCSMFDSLLPVAGVNSIG